MGFAIHTKAKQQRSRSGKVRLPRVVCLFFLLVSSTVILRSVVSVCFY